MIIKLFPIIVELIHLIHIDCMISLQQLNCEISTSLELKKTRKGWLGNKIKQTHLRDDIPCGFQFCPEHGHQCKIFSHEQFSEDTIYFIDTFTLIHQTDVIYNCNELKNLIILQSSLEKLKNYNPIQTDQYVKSKNSNINKYNVFKNYVETQQLSERKLYILADIYHRGINGKQSQGINFQKLQISTNEITEIDLLERTIKWYRSHCADFGVKNIKFVYLTADAQVIKDQSSQNISILSLYQFLKNCNSNLLDFIGFQLQSSVFKAPIYPKHLEINHAIQLVKSGKLFEGKFMNEKSYFKIKDKVYRLDLQNNRAMFGDIVIIELSDKNAWKSKFVKKVLEEEDQNPDNKTDLIRQIDQTELKDSMQSEEKQDLINFLDSNTNLQPVGKVVSIYKKLQKNYCGSINTDALVYTNTEEYQMKDQSHDQEAFKYEIFEFVPVDSNFPNFYIRTYNSESLKNKRIVVCFDEWPENAKYPLCHYIKTIGEIGEVKAEADIILLEHNVEIKQFSKKAYDCLPASGDQFSIPLEQLKYRLDLRNVDVCSIDPPGCKDIDDALHCIQLPNGHLQIGVHIADVSFYVRPDTALDLEARNRCTTVYLVDRRTDMLPKLLTENLCSLRANVDRLAFSTIWEIDCEANIVNTKYCKSIIRSRRAFTYMEAQTLMDSKDESGLAKSIRNMNLVAKKLKQKRTEKGALTLASTQVKITLAEETHSATDVQLYQMVETNHLIEEFMLLSNIAVAEKIYQRFPSISILRRHTQPKINDLETLKEIMSIYKYEFNFQTSKDLADSLNKIERKNDGFFNKLVRIMTTRCMNEATYFCSADFDVKEFFHYGLAAPFYTHFTSPIRRYADVLVHRLLAAAIDLQPLPNFMINKIKMTKICDKMNMRNRMARYASRASSDYHTYMFFKDRKEIEQAIITAIADQTITVMLIKYGLQSKINLSQPEQQQIVNLNSQKGIFTKVQISGKQFNLFDYINVEVKVELKGFHKVMEIKIVH